MYADDLVVVMSKASDVKKITEVIETWASLYNMKINYKKSCITVFQWKKLT